MIAPDDTTFEWVEGRPGAPEDFEAAVDGWRELRTDDGAAFDSEIAVDAGALSPAGHLGHHARRWSSPVTERGARAAGPTATSARSSTWASRPGTPMQEIRARPRVHRLLHELPHRRPARRRRGGRGPQGRRATSTRWSCRAPQQVAAQAEAEGLDEVFRAAGFDWRTRRLLDVPGHEPGHPRSPASAAPRPRTATSRAARAAAGAPTSSRPQMAAAAAIEGHFVDIREWS